MKPSILAARNQLAQQQLLAAATALGDRLGLTDALAALRAVPATSSRDPALVALQQREACAALLAAVVQALAAPADDLPPAAPAGDRLTAGVRAAVQRGAAAATPAPPARPERKR